MDVRAGDLIGAGRDVLVRRWRVLLVGGVIMVVLQALQKGAGVTGAGERAALAVLMMLVQFAVHAVIARKAMEAEGLVAPGTPARYGQYLLVSIVITVGAFLGAIVLIVPGIMLMARWFVANDYVLAQGLSFRQALAASRDATRGHRWAVVWAWIALVVLIGAPYVAVMGVAGGLTAFGQAPLLSGTGLAKLVWSVVTTPVSLALSIGSYSVLSRGRDRLGDVFA